MPRADKATFIQEMLSELQPGQNATAPSKPATDSKEWLREVAHRERARAEAAEQRLQTARAALEYIKPSLPVLATMCQTAGFALAEAKARDMHTTVDAALRATEVPTAPVPRCSICRRDDCHQDHACE